VQLSCDLDVLVTPGDSGILFAVTLGKICNDVELVTSLHLTAIAMRKYANDAATSEGLTIGEHLRHMSGTC